MTAYWVLLLVILVIASSILLSVLNRGKKGTEGSKTEPGAKTTGPGTTGSGVRPAGPGTAGSAVKTAGPAVKTAGPGTRTTGTGIKTGTGTATGGASVKNTPPVTPVVKKFTTVYAYKPTRSTVRCKTCDGENLHGTSLCCICGNYLN